MCDNEHGLNRLVEPELAELKGVFQDVASYAQAIPLIACIFLENKIARHYSFGVFYKMLAHGLTVALIVYTTIVNRNRLLLPEAGSVLTTAQQAERGERDQQAAMIGNLIYLAVAGSMMAATIQVKFIEGRSWPNVSVRCGLLLVKAAMLVAGKFGPLVYFCMMLQIYSFALIVNRRRDSQPGATFPLQIFFAFFTMHVYFLRTGHRERMSTVQVGKVCPGGVSCPEAVHHALLVFDMLAPYIIGHLCLPLTVRARVQYAYAHQYKLPAGEDDAGEDDAPAQVTETKGYLRSKSIVGDIEEENKEGKVASGKK